MLVAMGRGCAYLPERLALYARRNCKMLKIADSNDHFNLSVTWKVDEANHPLNLFVRLLTKFFEERFEQWVAENLTEV
jgi:DNA-binding transcriptional LysR family regulator